MKSWIKIVITLMVIVTVVGCSSSDRTKELVEYEGTVLSKSNTSFLVTEGYVEIDQELSLDEAYRMFGRGKVIRFIISEEKIVDLNVGDKVIVQFTGDFEDSEPRTGSAENVEIVEN